MENNLNIRKKNIYTKNKSIKSITWNALGSFLNATSSMILLIIVTRICGEFEGGIFAFAFSVSQLFLAVGNFEMRPYQSTDIDEKYSFDVYFLSRIITCTLMILITIMYIFIFNYTGEKGILIFLLCVYRMTDAFSDVFQGFFQIKDRLDLSGKSLSIRVILSTVIFLISMIMTKNIIYSSIYMILSCIIWIILFDISKYTDFAKIKIEFNFRMVNKLFIECMPLFLGAFLLMYIFNVPKYAIDDFMESNIQNYFNILFMPVSIINLFSIFLFRPVLTSLAEDFNECNYKKFIFIILKLITWIILLTVVFEAGSYLLGIPILSVIYNIDLSIYKKELLIMMLGGGFSALSTLLHYVITVMRRQKSLLIGYSIVSLIGMLISGKLVSSFGILGASYTYLILMILLSLIFVATLCYYIIIEQNNNR